WRHSSGTTTSSHGPRSSAPRGAMTEPLPTRGLHYDIPEPLYHADPASLSSSAAKTLIYEGPDALQEKRETPQAYLDAFAFGSVVHALVLGVGDFQVLAHESYRTKAAREERDALLAEGVAPKIGRAHV